jgi:hypothetical protein
MIKTAQDVIAVAKKRGFTIVVEPGPPPVPMLRYSKGKVDPKLANEPLMDALRAWRLEIIDIVQNGQAEPR